jgi:hypothetical protein
VSDGKPSLRDALGRLSPEERRDLFGPTPEDLVALAAGELPEERAAIVKAALAADPGAGVQLIDLLRFPNQGPPPGIEPVSDAEIEESWAEMQALLGAEKGGEQAAASAREVVRMPAKTTAEKRIDSPADEYRNVSWSRRIVPLAAAACLAGMVFGWLLRPLATSSSASQIEFQVADMDVVHEGQEVTRSSGERRSLAVLISTSSTKPYDYYRVEVLKPSGGVAKVFDRLRPNSFGDLVLYFDRSFPRDTYSLTLYRVYQGIQTPESHPRVPQLGP